MKKLTSLWMSLLLVAALGSAVGLSGCAHEEDEPIEDAVEETADEVGDAAEEAGDEIEDAADEIEDETDG